MQYRGRIIALAAVVAGFPLAGAQLDGQTAAQDRIYRLVSVDGQPLPVTVEEEDGCREEVAEATLTLRESGEWRLEVAEREVCGDAVDEEETDDEAGRYTTEGDTVRFLDDDADDEADASEEEADEADEADEEDDEGELDLDDLGVGTLDADGRVEAAHVVVQPRECECHRPASPATAGAPEVGG